MGQFFYLEGSLPPPTVDNGKLAVYLISQSSETLSDSSSFSFSYNRQSKSKKCL